MTERRGELPPDPAGEVFVYARVLSTKPARGGWGCWVELKVERIMPRPAPASFAEGLVGTAIWVSAPPAFSGVGARQLFEGPIAYRVGPQGCVFTLVAGAER